MRKVTLLQRICSAVLASQLTIYLRKILSLLILIVHFDIFSTLSSLSLLFDVDGERVMAKRGSHHIVFIND
jgi:hypothetical protein